MKPAVGSELACIAPRVRRGQKHQEGADSRGGAEKASDPPSWVLKYLFSLVPYNKHQQTLYVLEIT